MALPLLPGREEKGGTLRRLGLRRERHNADRPPGHLRRLLASAQQLIGALGVDPVRGIRAVLATPRFLKDLWTFRRLNRAATAPFPLNRLYPCLCDRRDAGGTARGHYFHQDLLVARKVFLRKPVRHLDVGSRVDGFVAHVASFREIEVVDIRPTASAVVNIRFNCLDLTHCIPEAFRGQYDSVSCLHALEHFGLGRYGDPIDPQGHIKGIDSLSALLSPGGTLYLSVPIGPQRLEFNSARVFSLSYLLGLVERNYRVKDFALVDDSGDLQESVTLTPERVANNYGVWYGCAILELEKC